MGKVKSHQGLVGVLVGVLVYELYHRKVKGA